MNEILWGVLLLVNFLLVIFIYRVAGRTGLYIWIPISTILANIQVVKMVELFGFESTLGNVVYATSFLVTDILSENYGREHAKKAVYIGFFSLISFALIMNLSLYFAPSQNDFAQKSMVTIFSLMPRFALASLIAYATAQFHDVWAYGFWKKLFPGQKYIWLRNNASTMVSQLFDTLIFTAIAFGGVYPLPVLGEIFLSTYILKWIVAAADTPFVYLAHMIKEKHFVQEVEDGCESLL